MVMKFNLSKEISAILFSGREQEVGSIAREQVPPRPVLQRGEQLCREVQKSICSATEIRESCLAFFFCIDLLLYS